MNLNALLDVNAQRAPSPLDRTVGDGGGDGAFADVLSQYGADDAGMSTNGAATTTQATAAPDPSAPPVAQTADQTLVDAEAAELAALDPAPQPGQTLPTLQLQGGQTLPLDPAAAPVEGSVPAGASRPADDATDDPTDAASDPTAAAIAAALLGAANAPHAAPVATTPTATARAMQSAAPRPADGAVTAPAATAPTGDTTLPDNAIATTDADPTIDATAFEGIRARLDRLQRRDDGATVVDPRRAQATAAATTPGAAVVGSALTPTLRALMRGRDDAAPPPANAAHAARSNGDVATAAVKPVAMEAVVVDANVRKEAPIARDDGDATVRIDAMQARGGGTDALRDAPVRLGDLGQQHAQRFAGELADRVLVMRNQRLDGATVTLEPRELGRIDIQVRLQADTTHVAFTAQHAAVRDALEGQLPRLRSMLEEAGLSLGAVDVAHAGARNATGGDAGSARSYDAPRAATAVDADAADSPTAWRPRASSSLIDLHA